MKDDSGPKREQESKQIQVESLMRLQATRATMQEDDRLSKANPDSHAHISQTELTHPTAETPGNVVQSRPMKFSDSISIEFG